ncbi:MAG: MFS transporter, partial [Rhabdochlamydiaceae bacterium]
MRWISISFIMMLGIIVPLAVYLAQRYGYKRIFFYGSVVFLLGSLLNSFAFDFTSVLLSRAIAGAGSGALFPLSIAILDKVFPKKQITLALILYVGLGFGCGSSLGYLTGGYFAQYFSWKLPFLLCFIIGCISLLITYFVHQETEFDRKSKFDIGGYLTFITFISSILLILNCAKAQWNTTGWNSPFMWSCYILSFVSLIVFIPLELKKREPLISFALFKTKSFLIGCIAIFFIGAPLYSTQLLTGTFLDGDLGYEKHTIGLLSMTLGITLGLTSACTVFLSKKISIRVLTLVGMGIITISCFLNPLISIYSSHTQFLWIWNLRMVGIGLALGPATSLSLSELSPAVAGAAAVFITLFRQVGGTIGSLWTEVVMDERNIFHREIFGSQMNSTSPAFQSTLLHLKDHLIRQAGALPIEAEAQARALIQENIFAQSHAASLGDAFFLLGIATLLSVITLLIEMGWSSIQQSRV